MPPPDSNGQNGHHDPMDDDYGFDREPIEEVPPVPPGHVVHTDSNGMSIIVPSRGTKNAIGRPSKRTLEAKRRILAAVRLGCTFKLAAAYGGLSYDVFNDWRREDEEFSEEIDRAVGIAAAQWMNIIENAAKVDWRAAAWKLQHRFPTEFGRSVSEISGPNGGPIQLREITVRVPDSLGIDDDGAIDEGPPELMLPGGDE